MIRNILLGAMRGGMLALGVALALLGATALEAGQWSGALAILAGGAMVYVVFAWRGWVN